VQKLRNWARRLQAETLTLWFAARERARMALADPRPRSRVAAAVIVALWIAAAALAAFVAWRAAR